MCNALNLSATDFEPLTTGWKQEIRPLCRERYDSRLTGDLSLEVLVVSVHGIEVEVVPPVLEEGVVEERVLDGGRDAFLVLGHLGWLGSNPVSLTTAANSKTSFL